jgi:EAL domain-containing protein (putative c-di-GMP-specific phosphodiesterase class I)
MEWANHTVLVVEDSAVQRRHVVEALEVLGFGAILEAGNGLHALRVLELRAAPVQLVVTDLDMPEMDGIELIRHLAERHLTQYLIVTTARDPRLFEIVERMASDDSNLRLLGTLAKPVKMNELVMLLEHSDTASLKPGVAAPAATVRIDEIDRAIRAREFTPYFQPKVNMSTGAIKGVEALARWRHPERGILTPDHFIPVIEGTPLMAPFTLLIAEETVRYLSTLHDCGMASLAASINLSADSLADRTFIDRLARLVDAYGIPSSLLIWEVTETMLMKNVSESLANLARLGLKGFGLAMDDYGIGYSSIQQFSRCPFTELKIDRAFVHEASRRQTRRAILESAIELGHRFNVATVAEGVETKADWDLLRTLGCDLAQGYLIGKPMQAGELPQWAKAHRTAMKSLAATIDIDGKAGNEAETRRDDLPVKLVAAGGKLAS